MAKSTTIPTEPIGSIPRPIPLIDAVAAGEIPDPSTDPQYEAAVRDTIERFEATGSPVITDGEQRKYDNFWTYSVHGLSNTAPDGFRIPFVAGHTRRMPRLTGGPFRYKRYADNFLANRVAFHQSGDETMTRNTRKMLGIIVAVALAWIAFQIIQDPESARRAFREGFRSTSGTPAP